MNIAVIGTGYVGVSTAVSLAKWHHDVIGVDVDERKVVMLQSGRLPFYEPGLDEELSNLVAQGRLQFTSRLGEAVAACDVLFVTVGTPSDVNGQADLSYVKAVSRDIASAMASYKLVVMKSTVPVGTCDTVQDLIAAELQRRGADIPFDVASNPEFLREGRALHDALNPERIVLGCASPRARQLLHEIYRPVGSPMLLTTVRNAEMVKYAANGFLAMKISFINQIARLCDKVGADVNDVAHGIGMDTRIGPQFLQAGIGYGGSCFPKDVKALIELGRQCGEPLSLLQEVEAVNQGQLDWFMAKVDAALQGLSGRRIALLGLTFKPGTDDIREAPALRIIPWIRERGGAVAAFDPRGTAHVRALYPDVVYETSPYRAVQGADAIVLLTEWQEIVAADWQQIRQLVNGAFLFDARNALDPDEMARHGFSYCGVGRARGD